MKNNFIHIVAFIAIALVVVSSGFGAFVKEDFICGTTQVEHNGITYSTVVSNGKCWLDRNLGASRVATSSADVEAYGDLYQWGRAADGHQKRSSHTTFTLSGSDTPGHGNFTLAPDDPYDWRSPQNDSLWQGVNGVNNPCPSGWRLPTAMELDDERESWATNNAAGAYSSTLKWSVAGYRGYSDGSLLNVGSEGNVWSSTVFNTHALILNFHSSDAYLSNYHRANGYIVRCIKDD